MKLSKEIKNTIKNPVLAPMGRSENEQHHPRVARESNKNQEVYPKGRPKVLGSPKQKNSKVPQTEQLPEGILEESTLNKKINLNIFMTKSKFSNRFRGIQLKVSGRLRGSERTKRMQFNLGKIGSQSIKSLIQSNKKQLFTKWGTYGLTVYISRNS